MDGKVEIERFSTACDDCGLRPYKPHTERLFSLAGEELLSNLHGLVEPTRGLLAARDTSQHARVHQ